MNYYIIVFKNTLDAMNGEKKSNDLNLSFRMMPTPTAITQSCGLCVRVEAKDEISKVIEDGTMIYKNIYLRTSEGYELVK